MTNARNGADDDREQGKNTLIAILLTCVAYAYFNIGDAGIKLLGSKFHFSQIITFNCISIIFCMSVWSAFHEGRKAFRVRNLRLILFRACLSLVVAVLNISALSNIHLTTFYTLVFTSPFWVAILSAIFLGERLERKRIGVILGGFAVILFIFRPGSGAFDVYALMVLASAFIYAASMIVMRKMGPQESRTMIICVGSFVSLLFAVPILPHHYVPPTPYEWGLFFMMGFLGAISVSCIAYAFQNAPSASVIAPYHYTQIVWGALLGYFLFGEVPNGRMMIGAAAIIAAGMYLIYGETRGRRKVIESLSRVEVEKI